VPPEPSPSVSIAVSAVSIDLTAISINLAVSYDEEGVELHKGSLDHVKQLTRSKHEAHGGEDNQLATAIDP
jgi:hypothetical protein